MATKSGRSTTGTRKQPGRTAKSVKVPAKKAGAKRGSAKKAPSKEGGRRAKAAGEPRFYLIFKGIAPPDLYVVPVTNEHKVTANKACLNENYSNVPETVTAYLVETLDDEPFRTCGPSHP